MVNALTPLQPLPASIAGLMMNKSLRARRRESSGKAFHGFQRGEEYAKKRAAVSGGF
jgi:hypothetical protein